MFKSSKAHTTKEIWDLQDSVVVPQPQEKELELITKSDSLSVGEKIEILSVYAGYKLLGDIHSKIAYQFDPLTQQDCPIEDSVSNVSQLLDQLSLPTLKQTTSKFSRKSGKQRMITWYSICANNKVKHFVEKYSEELSALEEGILYGFPQSAVIAFMGFSEQYIPSKRKVYEHYLCGTFSKKHFEQESEYLRDWWEQLRQICPSVIETAEMNFNTK